MQVERFGPLRDLDTGAAPLPGLVAVYGPNEAGKSSLFTALRSLLHGFYPASRDGHPMAPWDGTDAEVRGEVEAADGTRARIHRRLLSTPWGRLHLDGSSEDLRNESLPWTRHLSRQLYEEMFTVTLPQLTALQTQKGWAEVRDRLVTGMGGLDLASPGQVAEALEREAHGLWRPSRRGTPRDRELEKEERKLHKRLSQARERDEDLRKAARRLEALEVELAELDEERRNLARIRTFLPVARRLRRLDELRRTAGNVEALNDVPPDPVARLEELRSHVDKARRQREAASEDLKALEEKCPAESPQVRALLERKERAVELISASPVVEERATRLPKLRERLKGLDEEVEARSQEIFRDGGPPPEDALRQVDLPELRSQVTAWKELESRKVQVDELFAAETSRSEGPEPSLRPPIGVWVAGSLALVLLAGGGLPAVRTEVASLPGWSLLLLALGTLSGVACWLGWRGWAEERRDWARSQREREEARHRLEHRLRELENEGEEVQARMTALLKDLPVRSRPQGPDDHLPRELERLRDLLTEGRRIREEVEELEAQDARLDAALSDLLRRIPGLEPGRGAVETLAVLRERLQRSEEEDAQRGELLREMEAVRQQEERAAGEEKRAEEALDDFVNRLTELTGLEPPEEAAREAARRQEARSNARRIEGELKEEFGELEEIRSEVERALEETKRREGGQGAGTPSSRSWEDALTMELERLDRRRDELDSERADLNATLRPVQDEETVDVLQGALEAIREERGRVRKERDRLWLLARIVRVAERRFREANQPELLRRAARHLARFTQGRYRRLILGNEEDGDLLLLQAPHLPGTLPAEEPISAGTREQVYMALRLAVAELLEGEGETLPLILDEVFVNWDPERRRQGIQVLSALSGERQIFLFTCHPRIAEEVVEKGGARIDLNPAPIPHKNGE